MVDRTSQLKQAGFKLWSVLWLGILYTPVFFLVALGFNSSSYALKWEGFSFRWYEHTLSNPEMVAALFNSILVATLSTLIAVILGFLYAFWSHRAVAKRVSGMSDGLMSLPLFIPEIVIAIGLLVLVSHGLRPLVDTIGLSVNSMTAITLGHATLALGYASLVLRNRFKSYDLNQELAAQDLGASRLQIFLQIMLPQLMPGFAAAACLSFAVSLDDFYVSYFLSTGGSSLQTLPLYIWSLQGRRAMTPEINVVSSLLLSIALVFFAAGLFFNRLETKLRTSKKDAE